MSSRNVRSANPTRERILDAAAHYSRAMHRQPAIAELARHAGVSRPTVYRYFTDGDALFRALWEREIGVILDAHSFDFTTLDDLVARIVQIADEISRHELLAPTLHPTQTADSALVAHYIVDRFGTSQRLVFDRLRTAIEDGQAAGGVRRGQADELTAMVMLIVQSAVQSRAMIAEFLDDRAWARELGQAIRGYLQ